MHHSFSPRFTHFQRPALHIIAVKRRYRSKYKGKEQTLDDGIGDIVRVECKVQAVDEILEIHHPADNSGNQSAQNPDKHTENVKYRIDEKEATILGPTK